MSAQNEMNRHALREHREAERETLERVQAEALAPELLREGEDPEPVIVDGYRIEPRRIRGKLTVRW